MMVRLFGVRTIAQFALEPLAMTWMDQSVVVWLFILRQRCVRIEFDEESEMNQDAPLQAIHSGQRLIYRRRIGNEDIRAFAELSGDRGDHHVTPDEQGRLIAHGLLVISTATRLGSDIHYLAHTMTWMFIRPVYGGDEVEARVELKRVQEQADRLDVEMAVRIVNQHGQQVVRGESTGVIVAPAVRALFRGAPADD